jgi:hypothetical protein
MSPDADIITAAELLTDYGITVEDVRRLCPGAVEYSASGGPYWVAEDLTPLRGGTEHTL